VRVPDPTIGYVVIRTCRALAAVASGVDSSCCRRSDRALRVSLRSPHRVGAVPPV